MKRAGKVILFRRKSGFYFRIIGGNGKVVAQSEGYKTKQSRMRGIRSAWNALAFGGVVDRD